MKLRETELKKGTRCFKRLISSIK